MSDQPQRKEAPAAQSGATEKPVETTTAIPANVGGSFAVALSKKGATKVHAADVQGKVEGPEGNQQLTIGIALKDLETAKPSSGARTTPGISLTVRFTYCGKPFKLHAGYMTLTAD